MLIIDSSAALARALDQPIDPDLKRLLVRRTGQLASDTTDLAAVVRFVAAEPGDTLAAIEAALGLPIATNLVDDSRFGEPDFTLSWEWAERHDGGWVELVFIVSDDFAHVLLVQECDGIDADLRELCRRHVGSQHERVSGKLA